ncbi:MAG: Hsp20/alpha crystallin family protein [Lachnospiraceae bacterium]
MLMPSIFGENLFDDFMDDFFEDFPVYDEKDMKKLEKKLYGHRAKNLMKTDIKETRNAYKLEMDLPGFKKEDVKVSLEEGYLTVCAAKGMNQEEQEKKTGKYIRRERYAGACERSFYVGEDVTEDDIRGEFKHGVLKLTIQKKEAKSVEDKSRYIAIER